MERTLIFKSAFNEPPTVSGEYLCYIDGEWVVLMFSAKHGLFNAYDTWPKLAARKNAIHPTYWAELPEL